MKASFKARLRSKDKLVLVIGVISLLAWQFGAAGRARADVSTQQNSQTFEIKLQSNQDLDGSDAGLAYDEIVSSQQQTQQTADINREVTLVQSYLQSKGSPLANYTGILLAQPDWKTIIAISNSESTLGKHCYVNNCSGIFGQNGLRTYENIPAWIVDMQNLLTTRYSGWSLQQMDGVYVYPRSKSWIMASSSVYNDLTQIQNQLQQS